MYPAPAEGPSGDVRQTPPLSRTGCGRGSRDTFVYTVRGGPRLLTHSLLPRDLIWDGG